MEWSSLILPLLIVLWGFIGFFGLAMAVAYTKFMIWFYRVKIKKESGYENQSE